MLHIPFRRSGSPTRFCIRSGSPICKLLRIIHGLVALHHIFVLFVVCFSSSLTNFVCIYAVTAVPVRVLTAIKNLKFIPYCNLTVAGHRVKSHEENVTLGNLLSLADAPLDRSGERNLTFAEFMAITPVAVRLTKEAHGTRGDRLEAHRQTVVSLNY